MAKGYTNRKENIYFIKKRKTKTGKTAYTMTQTESADCVDELPEGYEVHEIPESGQMVVRKELPMLYDLKEIHFIKKSLAKNKTISDFKLDTRLREIVIYTAENPVTDALSQLASLLGPNLGSELEGMKRYEAQMRIIKKEAGDGFVIQRYCYKGSIDDWITVGSSKDLKKLAETYIPHLGKESFFELSYNFGE